MFLSRKIRVERSNRNIRRQGLAATLLAAVAMQGCISPAAYAIPAEFSNAGDRNAEPSLVQTVGDSKQPAQAPQPASGIRQTLDQARARAAAQQGVPIDLEGRPIDPRYGSESGSAQSFVSGQAVSMSQTALQGWLQRFGTTRLGLDAGSFQGGSLDMLFPLFDNKHSSLLFSQVGVRRDDRFTDSFRTTVNLGLGYRHFFDAVMLGGNAFYDADVTRGNRRYGLGAEVWADYLKLNLNGYFRTSGWKSSPDLDDALERPANGFDIRAEGYLPQLPQLGVKLAYEKYYGNEVGLFGTHDRQRDPGAWTVGLSYTPAPALSFALEERMGSQGMRETAIMVNAHFAIGTPLAKQFDFTTQAVRASRQLDNMRRDLVERNNDIVLEYRSEHTVTVQLPTSVTGTEGSQVAFPVTLTGAKGSAHVQWSGTAAQFVQPYDGSGTGTLTLPPYNAGEPNVYQLAARAEQGGNSASSNFMTVVVNATPVSAPPPSPVLHINIDRSKPIASADGADAVTFTATVQDAKAQPVANANIAWKVTKGVASFKSFVRTTNTRGQAAAVITSFKADDVEVQAALSDGTTAQGEAQFVVDLASAAVVKIDGAPNDPQPANGTGVTTLRAMVKDKNGSNVGSGVTVRWKVAGRGKLQARTSQTDSDGVAQASLIAPERKGTATITANADAADGDTGKTTTVAYVLDLDSARIDNLSADSTHFGPEWTRFRIRAQAKDLSGKDNAPGATIEFSANRGEFLDPTTVVADAHGKAHIDFRMRSITTCSGATSKKARITVKASGTDPGKEIIVEVFPQC